MRVPAVSLLLSPGEAHRPCLELTPGVESPRMAVARQASAFLSRRRRCCCYLAALGRLHLGRTEAGRSTLCLCFCCCRCSRHCCHEGREQDCTLPRRGTALFSLRLPHCILPWGGAQATLEVHPGGGISNNGQGKGRVCCLSCLCRCVQAQICRDVFFCRPLPAVPFWFSTTKQRV